jgi:ADP-ribose pyrophosphatase YjhB (NUDIX family)
MGEFDVQGGKFFVCVDGVCIKDGKILLLKRRTEPFKGCWSVVGGHVEENETLKEALRREFKEETNLGIDVGNIIDGRIEETSDRTKIIIAFEVTFAHGEISLNPENEEYGWFDKIPLDSVYNYAKYLPNKSADSNKPDRGEIIKLKTPKLGTQ